MRPLIYAKMYHQEWGIKKKQRSDTPTNKQRLKAVVGTGGFKLKKGNRK